MDFRRPGLSGAIAVSSRQTSMGFVALDEDGASTTDTEVWVRRSSGAFSGYMLPDWTLTPLSLSRISAKTAPSQPTHDIS